MPDVVLVDSGGANIASVQHAFGRLGVATQLSRDPHRIARASHVVLPGVGAAAPAMQRLRELQLIDTLRTLRQPVLGICLGMQLLFDGSDEGETACLGLIPGQVVAMPPSPGLRVPHMGWNRLVVVRSDPLLYDLEADAHAYFVHSYAVAPDANTLAVCRHGREFAAAVRKDNYYGVQFHPERSGGPGARILRNFINL